MIKSFPFFSFLLPPPRALISRESQIRFSVQIFCGVITQEISSIKWTASARTPGSSLRVGELIKSESSSICAEEFPTCLHVTSVQWKRRVSQAFVDFSSLFNYDRASDVSDELIRSSPPPPLFFHLVRSQLLLYTQRAAGTRRRDTFAIPSPSQTIFFVNNIASSLIEVLGESPSCRKLPRGRL